jgi:hypothetical protein
MTEDDYDIITGLSGNKYKIHKTPPFKSYNNEDKDWSLKGKLISSRSLKDILVDADINTMIYGTTADMEINRIVNKEFGYTKEDIETLRWKLIEDIDATREDLFSGRYWKVVIKQKVNKRFGVKK